jgi:exodeoxyribonuclease VII large subunit
MNESKVLTASNSIYTVSELNREARELLNGYFSTVRVEGEISNLSTPSSGHVYFSLKDDAAQIRCALFRPQIRRSTPALKNGLHIIVTAQVSLYEPRGDYQLIVEHLEEAGFGALQRAFLQMKEKLAAEGLFDAAHKRPLPHIPACIGVITSASGAALHDILTVLRRRFAAVPVIVYPTSVQGQNAKDEIVNALRVADQRRECDLLIVARGGGSLEDLCAFNEEAVARAIYVNHIPVITGIGHETDFTIADFVADLRAPTPSAAAEHAVPDGQALLHLFRQQESRLFQLMRTLIARQSEKTAWLDKRLQSYDPGRRLQNNAQRLDDLEVRLRQALEIKLHKEKAHISALVLRARHFHPEAQLQALALRQEYLQQRLGNAMNGRLRRASERLAVRSQALHTVSPLATLQRGYAIVTMIDGTAPLTSAAELRIGAQLQTRLAHGRFVSRVEAIDKKCD